MRTKDIFWCIPFLIIFPLAACTAGRIPTEEPSNVASPTSLQSPTASLSPEIQSSPLVNPTSTAARSPTAIPALNPYFSKECLQSVTETNTSLLQTGSILFNYSGSGSNSTVWAVNSGSAEPQKILEIPIPAAFVNMSGSGTKLAWGDLYSQPIRLVIFDLLTNQEMSFQWDESWKLVWGWTTEDQVIMLISEEQVLDVGKSIVYTHFDPTTEASEIVSNTLDLPGFYFWDNHPLGGFASLDPAGKRVVYTADGETGVDLVLRDLDTGRELWRHQGLPDLVSPPADWRSDGSEVAFALYDEDGEFIKLFSLSRSGDDLTELTSRPFYSKRDVIRDIKWSPEGRYIHFALWQTAADGPGLILDKAKKELHEICTAGGTFIRGTWLTNDSLFLYRFRVEDGGEGHGREILALLDVNSWEIQLLAEAPDPDTSIKIIGWSPLLLP